MALNLIMFLWDDVTLSSVGTVLPILLLGWRNAVAFFLLLPLPKWEMKIEAPMGYERKVLRLWGWILMWRSWKQKTFWCLHVTSHLEFIDGGSRSFVVLIAATRWLYILSTMTEWLSFELLRQQGHKRMQITNALFVATENPLLLFCCSEMRFPQAFTFQKAFFHSPFCSL